MKKKILGLISIFLSVAFMLSISACTPGETPTVTDSNSSTQTPSESETDNPWAKPRITLENKQVNVMLPWPEDHMFPVELKEMFKEAFDGEAIINTVPVSETPSALVAQGMTGNVPDVVFGEPLTAVVLPMRDLVEPLENFINLEHPMWDSVRPISKQFAWEGKEYFAPVAINPYMDTIYNVRTIEDAGLEMPRDLYYKNEWTWDKFLEYAKILSDIPNNKFGAASPVWEAFLGSAGLDLISVGEQGLINNARSPEIARVMNFIGSFNSSEHNVLGDQNTFSEDFRNGNLAMVITVEWHKMELWNDLWENGELDFCPAPRDPQAEYHYEYMTCGGYMIPKGAKNPEGGAAFIVTDKMYKVPEMQSEEQKEKGIQTALERGYTMEDIELDRFRRANNVGMIQLLPAIAPQVPYRSLWEPTIIEGTPWSNTAERLHPVIESSIARFTSN